MSVPAPISDAALQALIIAQVGDEAGVLAANIPTLWTRWAGKLSVHPDLRDLYVRRDCIRLVLPAMRKKADIAQAGGGSVRTSAWFDHLLSMLAEIQAEIVRIERRAAASRPGVVTPITTVTGSVPLDSPNAPAPDPYVDANAPIYRGDPYQSPGEPPASPSSGIDFME